MTALAIDRSQRRGACPGLSAPMPTGDGLLVRLLPIGTIPLAAFKHLCAAARRHGNGIIEVTGRGSIQVRGLNAASARRFADADRGARYRGGGRRSRSSATRLPGSMRQEILDANALAADLRHALTRTSLDRKARTQSFGHHRWWRRAQPRQRFGRRAHLRVQATGIGAVLRSRYRAGTKRQLDGKLARSRPLMASTQSVRLLEVIAQHGRTARARDILAAEGDAPFAIGAAGLLIEDETPRGMRSRRDPIGSHRAARRIARGRRRSCVRPCRRRRRSSAWLRPRTPPARSAYVLLRIACSWL